MRLNAGPAYEPHNRLLDRLLQDCPVLAPALERRAGHAGEELYREGSRISHLCFPTRGVVSVVVRLSDGAMADVQTVGNEGLVGLPAWLGIVDSPDTVIQQSDGEIVRIGVAPFNEGVRRSAHACRLLNAYTAYGFRFSSQTCVCNTHHSVRQRLCRWLLSSADRAGATDVALTQAMLAVMLGVRRQSVGEVLVSLHLAGVIGQRRGRIQLVDRPRLEELACECYATTRELYARLVAPLL